MKVRRGWNTNEPIRSRLHGALHAYRMIRSYRTRLMRPWGRFNNFLVAVHTGAHRFLHSTWNHRLCDWNLR